MAKCAGLRLNDGWRIVLISVPRGEHAKGGCHSPSHLLATGGRAPKATLNKDRKEEKKKNQGLNCSASAARTSCLLWTRTEDTQCKEASESI